MTKKLHSRKWVERQIALYESFMTPGNDAQDRWINSNFRATIRDLQAELADIDLLDNPDADLLESARAANTRLRELIDSVHDIAGRLLYGDMKSTQKKAALERIHELTMVKLGKLTEEELAD